MGSAISASLAREGAKVVLADINQEAVDREEQSIRKNGGSAFALRWDLGDINAAAQHLSTIDTLGFMHQGLSSDFAPFPATSNRIAGWAYTIRGQMTPYEQGGDAEKMKAQRQHISKLVLATSFWVTMMG